MRRRVLAWGAAVATTGGLLGLLAGCSAAPSADQPAPPASTPPTSPAIPPAAADRAPLGFEIRYLDENGKFVTVAPEDFPR